MTGCRIRCCKQWHQVLYDGSQVILPEHNTEEEETADLFGERTSSCFDFLKLMQDQPEKHLYIAAFRGDIERARIALAMGADVNYVYWFRISQYVTEEYPWVTRVFSIPWPEPNYNVMVCSPLMLAYSRRHQGVVDEIMAAGTCEFGVEAGRKYKAKRVGYDADLLGFYMGLLERRSEYAIFEYAGKFIEGEVVANL